MALTFATATTELLARGFDDLSATRSGYFINRAYQRICGYAPWPFLEKDSTPGTAPVTISDLRSVLWVADSTNDVLLTGIDQRAVRDIDPDLAATGLPAAWYLTGTTTLNVYPANTTVTIKCRYIKIPATLTGTDSLVIPERYEYLLIDQAAVLAYKDSDNYDAASSLQADISIELEDMARDLLDRNYQNQPVIVATGSPFDANA